ncbi:MAG: Zn-ribbon domain-containing OB-fold protein [Candidatus Hodarchaeota archaeon]
MRSIQESLITRLKVQTKIGNKIKVFKCSKCGNIRNPPRTYCNICQGTDFAEVVFGPKGEITTYTSSYKRKETDKQLFFGMVRIFSENGKDSMGVSGSFDVKSIDELEIGKRVELIPDEKNNIFKLLEG